jgi:hypothetical protein
MRYQTNKRRIDKWLSSRNMDMSCSVSEKNIIPVIHQFVNIDVPIFLRNLLPSFIKKTIAAAVIASVMNIPSIKYLGRRY